MNFDKVKQSLYLNGYFSLEELKHLKPSELKYFCECCNKKCNRLHLLEDCENKMKICFDCLEIFFDNTNDKNILFVCSCCNKNIENYTNIL